MYQPIVDLKEEHVGGFESLLRWEHPEYGLTRPDAFLDIATELGLMKNIGEWTFMEACRQLRMWEDQFSPSPSAHRQRQFLYPTLCTKSGPTHPRGHLPLRHRCLQP